LLGITPTAKGGHWALTRDSSSPIENGRPYRSANGDKYGFVNSRGIWGARVLRTYGICRQTFYDEVKRGRIKAKKLGKKTVVLRSDAEKWAASLPALNLAVIALS
jgi:hypothetical protein